MLNGFQRLDALNGKLCEESGADRGHDTTGGASRLYYTMLYERRDEIRALIPEARKDALGHQQWVVDEMVDALAYAISQHG